MNWLIEIKIETVLKHDYVIFALKWPLFDKWQLQQKYTLNFIFPKILWSQLL